MDAHLDAAGAHPDLSRLLDQLNYCQGVSALLNEKPRDGDGQFEAAGTCAAGIDIDHAIAFFMAGFMRMSADDELESRGAGIQLQLRPIMQHAERAEYRFHGYLRQQ